MHSAVHVSVVSADTMQCTVQFTCPLCQQTLCNAQCSSRVRCVSRHYAMHSTVHVSVVPADTACNAQCSSRVRCVSRHYAMHSAVHASVVSADTMQCTVQFTCPRQTPLLVATDAYSWLFVLDIKSTTKTVRTVEPRLLHHRVFVALWDRDPPNHSGMSEESHDTRTALFVIRCACGNEDWMGTQLKYLCGKGDTTVSLAAVRHNWRNLYWCVSL